METAIRWAPSSTAEDHRFLLVDIVGRSFKICHAARSRGPKVSYDILSSRSDVPAFRSFDWSPTDESLVAIGQSSGEATVLRMNDDAQSPLVFPARNQRYCNAVSFSTQGLLAAGLDKVRNDFCLNIWDLNQRVSPSRNVRGLGSDRQAVEPLRKFAASEPITSVKFFKGQPETLVAGVKGQYVRIYDLREGNANPSLQFSTRCVHNLAIDWQDENYFASAFPSNDVSICIWDRRYGTRYPISSVLPTADTGNLSAALEFKHPVKPGASIWSLRFARTKRGCLGMVSSAGEFRAYDIAKEYVSDEYRSSAEHTYGHDPANSPEPVYTKNVREFRSFPLLQRRESTDDATRVTAFDFVNHQTSNSLSAITVMADKSVAFSFLPPSSPCPMDLSSQGFLARGGFSLGKPMVKISAPSSEVGTAASDIARRFEDRMTQSGDTNGTPSEREKSSHSLTTQQKLPVADILAALTVCRLRCKEGYLFDAERNKAIVADNPALQELWDWIGSSRSRSMDGSMVIDGVDLNYLGVYSIWNGNLGRSLENRVAGLGIKAKDINISALLRELVNRQSIPQAKGCASKLAEQRQLGLRICGAKESAQDLEATVNQLVADRHHTKAAALAVFQGERKLAYRCLRQNQPTQAHKTLAMAIIGSSKGETDTDWEETCSEIAKELTDPYARAILALVSKGDWHSVLEETTLPLRYRVEVALRWLPDDELTTYLRKTTIDVIHRGDVEGIILTGLDHAAMDLFQSYINKYSDIQTPVLAMSHTVPRLISNTDNKTRHDAWRSTYRRRMNSWKLHLQRAKFDVEASKLAVAWDGRRLVRPPPQQISLVCNYCTRPLSQEQDDPEASARPETVHLTSGHPLATASMTGTVCPKCGRHMPRCGICSLWLGSPDPMSRASMADDAKKEKATPSLDEIMKRFVVFCINCNHGFHADHARAWFQKHRICPVAELKAILSSKTSAYHDGSVGPNYGLERPSAVPDTQRPVQHLTATQLEQLPPDLVLQMSLRTTSVISTFSSFALRAQRAVRPELQDIIQIGEGLQAAVFEQVGLPLVMKKEKPGNENLRSNLQREYIAHLAVQSAFEHYEPSIGSHISLPIAYDFIPRTQEEEFWTTKLEMFPQGYQTRGNIVNMSRIMPLPKVVRKALITKFYPFEVTDEHTRLAITNDILNKVPNKHCLARTYLGRLDGTYSRESFSLRNFLVYLRSMQQLGLEVKELAALMGKAFAIMHWGAGVNGDDVEFVLGTSAAEDRSMPPGFQRRAVRFYLLDFGQCEMVDFSDDPDIVYQSFKGAMVAGDNQSFIPHYRQSPDLFDAFKTAYMEAGQFILEQKELEDKFSMEDFMAEYEEYAEEFLL